MNGRENVQDIHAILKQYWGFDAFRPAQEDIIGSVLAGKDTLALLPTGGGKSLCFQVPALAIKGVCVVITPLIALMKDQVENLQVRKIPAAAIYSGLHQREIELVLNDCIFGKIKFLYLSPERLKTALLRNSISRIDVSLLAVDEAHCVSQWGYDFRPPYLEIAQFRELLPPSVPVLALTATATPKVVEDIQKQLNFKEKNVIQRTFYRPNLTYYVFKTEDKKKRLLLILNRLEGSAIIYVRNRRTTKEIAEFLQKNGIWADFYHAGLDMKTRADKQNRWKSGKCRVIVATNAFGMGIDKPDVRTVIHIDIPDTLEAYFQEAGRAGRDGKSSQAILLYQSEDQTALVRNFENAYPPLDTIKNIYQSMCNFFGIAEGSGEGYCFDFDMRKFAMNYNLKPLVIYNSLKFLSKAGFIEFSETIANCSKVFIPISREELYRFQLKNEKFDGFIKLLLRSYSGLLTVFTNIDEKTLAQRDGTNIETIIGALKQLNKMEVLIYQPYTGNPTVTFLHDRISSKHMMFSQAVYQTRKDIAKEQLEAVLEYVSSQNKCRSRLLLQYFGEEDSLDCQKCDVCRKEKRETVTPQEEEQISQKIIELLSIRQRTLSEIIKLFALPEQKILFVIRKLLDNQKITIDKDIVKL
ncbi:MAG: RecQ family ATP-dependent DNA helicase [Bacteroidales bacterium]|jgi:ATP-dependent DNA helicase RecQ|nr:RecQ family ATP-dependent DNA helicase [Bacteroidales bacterium]